MRRRDDERARWRRHVRGFRRFQSGAERVSTARNFSRAVIIVEKTRARIPQVPALAESEIRALAGDKLLGEPRFNPDGTIDIFRWSRPQYDGPALRALACLHYLAAGGPRNPMR